MRKTKPIPKLKLPMGSPRERALAWLRNNGSPRLLMSMMLMTTIGSSFLSSVQMHEWGLKPLVRYPLAVIVGWIVFLLLVGAWVMWQRWRNAPAEESNAASRSQLSRGSRSSSDSRNGGSPSIDFPVGRSGGSWGGGGGGQFGGAGASESFAEASHDVVVGEIGGSIFESSSASASGSGGLDLDLDLDVGEAGGFLLLVAAIVLVAFAVFGAAIYAVYNAPIFFAELLIDGGVGTWLYRRANVASRPDWMSTAIKRSAWPAVILIAFFVALAWTMNYVAPGTMTLSEAFNVFVTP
jgi:hypothetical protein